MTQNFFIKKQESKKDCQDSEPNLLLHVGLTMRQIELNQAPTIRAHLKTHKQCYH